MLQYVTTWSTLLIFQIPEEITHSELFDLKCDLNILAVFTYLAKGSHLCCCCFSVIAENNNGYGRFGVLHNRCPNTKCYMYIHINRLEGILEKYVYVAQICGQGAQTCKKKTGLGYVIPFPLLLQQSDSSVPACCTEEPDMHRGLASSRSQARPWPPTPALEHNPCSQLQMNARGLGMTCPSVTLGCYACPSTYFCQSDEHIKVSLTM